IDFRVGGSVSALTSLMRREPLSRAADGLSAMPTQMKGKADIGIREIAPLVKNPPDGQLDYAVDGSLTDLDATLSNGNKFLDAKMTIKAGPDALDVTGAGQLAGVPAAISYKKNGKAPPAVQLKLTLDDATRVKRGFDTGSALTGPIAISITG